MYKAVAVSKKNFELWSTTPLFSFLKHTPFLVFLETRFLIVQNVLLLSNSRISILLTLLALGPGVVNPWLPALHLWQGSPLCPKTPASTYDWKTEGLPYLLLYSSHLDETPFPSY